MFQAFPDIFVVERNRDHTFLEHYVSFVYRKALQLPPKDDDTLHESLRLVVQDDSPETGGEFLVRDPMRTVVELT
jgi:hypothetical protein